MNEREQIEAILRDLSMYFAEAKPEPGSTERNMALARPLKERWGVGLVAMGFAWIANDLRISTRETLHSMLPERILDAMIAKKFSEVMSCMHDLVQVFGSEAGMCLAASVTAASVEDVRALVAFMLASDTFSSPAWTDVLQAAFNKSEGTSCRLAIAFALYKSGRDKQIKQFVKAGYFAAKPVVKLLENFAKQAPKQTREALVITELLFPGATGILSPEAAQSLPGLVKILALDIGSNGAAFENNPMGLPWKRKD